MLAVARHYSGRGAVRVFDELAQKREDIERIMRGVPGFIAYSLFRTRDGGISVTICQTRAGIDDSINRAAAWVRANVPVTVDPPEVSEGWIVSVDRQSAISEVLKLISRSEFDLKAIMQVLLENAVHLCDAQFGLIYRHSAEGLELLGLYPPNPELELTVQQRAASLEEGSFVGRVQQEATVLNLENITDSTYLDENVAALHERLGLRAALGVPLSQLGLGFAEDECELAGTPSGVLTLFRTESRAFVDLHVQLAQTFADQAAIAIDYIRLLGEVRRQTQEVERLKIEIDQVRREKEVNAITNTDLFRDLQDRARNLRGAGKTEPVAKASSVVGRIGGPPTLAGRFPNLPRTSS